jgi:hypothetical protein
MNKEHYRRKQVPVRPVSSSTKAPTGACQRAVIFAGPIQSPATGIPTPNPRP